MSETPPDIIVIGGPTGVGKTALSLALAEAIDAEIVSIDSLQVYRHLDIGTAKASAEEKARVPHHMLDLFEPDEECNVADFMRRAHESIADILARGKHVIAVGGTNLYVRVLVHGIFEAPPADEAIRARHKAQASEHGIPWLHRRLEDVDPVLAGRIHENDLVRISRGLEVHEQTGRALSELQDEHRFQTPNYRAMKIMLNRPRAELYQRIDARVDAMFEAGLEAEYRNIVEELGFDYKLKPLQSLGYRHLGHWLYEGMDRDEMLRLFKRDTRRFAKQQISWLRSERGVRWALAPVIQGDTIPAVVSSDVRTFLAGGEPEGSWLSEDSEKLKEIA